MEILYSNLKPKYSRIVISYVIIVKIISFNKQYNILTGLLQVYLHYY